MDGRLTHAQLMAQHQRAIIYPGRTSFRHNSAGRPPLYQIITYTPTMIKIDMTSSSSAAAAHAKTRKLCCRKDDRAMRPIMSASHVLIHIKLNRVFFVRFLVSPKLPHVPLGVGGCPLRYEERKCWSNYCPRC